MIYITTHNEFKGLGVPTKLPNSAVTYPRLLNLVPNLSSDTGLFILVDIYKTLKMPFNNEGIPTKSNKPQLLFIKGYYNW